MPNATQNDDLISRASFERKLEANIGKTVIGQLLIGCLRNEPVVEAAPVIHACWKPIYGDTTSLTECSNCGSKSSILFADQFQYCPVCGAKMDLKEDL